jgi:hypothetical protein
MEFGQYELQILISLVVIMGAAFVALICDFLKGNNEQLRELVIQLSAGREEELKRPRRAEVAGTAVNREALPVREPRSAPPVRPRPAAVWQPPAVKAAPRIELAPKPRPEPIAPAVRHPKKDWSGLLAKSSVKTGPLEKKITIVRKSEDAGLPRGYHDRSTLDRLFAQQMRISGLIVSIGVSGARSGGKIGEAVIDLIQSMIRQDEFACARGEDEFILICPGERGAASQRRLNRIAQQLWDFQLRSLGTLPVVFSWGGVEVSGEAIEEAVALAAERMLETRRGRAALCPQPALKMRAAV